MNCSFCVSDARTARTLFFARWRPAICDECLQICNEIITDDEAVQPSALPGPIGLEPFLEALPQQTWEQLLRTRAMASPREDPRQDLRCSFCAGRGERLIAGPRVFICNACVALCNEAAQSKIDARLLEIDPPPRGDEPPPPPPGDPGSRHLSEPQRARVRGAVQRQLDRRYAELLAAQAALVGTTDPVSGDEGDDGEQASDDHGFGEHWSERIGDFMKWSAPLGISGGRAAQRQRIARRVHDRSPRAAGPFVGVDARNPGALANLHDAEDGTLFVDYFDRLTPDAQQLLAILTNGRDLPRRIHVICGSPSVKRVRSQIEGGALSAYMELCVPAWLPIAAYTQHGDDIDSP